MNVLIDIVDQMPDELSHVKSYLSSVLNPEDEPDEWLSQLKSLFSSSHFPESDLQSKTNFSAHLKFLTSQIPSLFYIHLFMLISKNVNCTELSEIVNESKLPETIVQALKVKFAENASNFPQSLHFCGLDNDYEPRCYFEFLEFLNKFTFIELSNLNEKMLISHLYTKSDNLILQSIFFESYTKGLRFIRICNNYYKAMQICSEIINENAQVLSPSFFKLFKFLMIKTNKNSSIILKKKKFHCAISYNILGIKDLIYLFYNSQKSLYKKCEILIGSLFICRSTLNEENERIKLIRLFSALIDQCKKDNKSHIKRLIKIIYLLLKNKQEANNCNNIEVLVNFDNQPKIVNFCKKNRVRNIRQIIAQSFNLDSSNIIFKIDKKKYPLQKYLKKLKIDSNLFLNIKINTHISETPFKLISEALIAHNDFFWELNIETVNEKFNKQCQIIAETTLDEEIYESFLNFNFTVSSIKEKPDFLQFKIVFLIKGLFDNINWVKSMKELNFDNDIFEYLLDFIEKYSKSKILSLIIKLIQVFINLNKPDHYLTFRIFQTAVNWILSNPDENLKLYENEIFSVFKDTLKRPLFIEILMILRINFMEKNDEIIIFLFKTNLDPGLLKVLIKIAKDMNVQGLNQTFNKLDGYFKELLDLNPRLMIKKIPLMQELNHSPIIILDKVFNCLFKYPEGIDNETSTLILTTILKFPQFKLTLSEFKKFLLTFLIPHDLNPNLPLYKDSKLRANALIFVHAQCKSDKSKLQFLLDSISLSLLKKSWRGFFPSQYNIKQSSFKLNVLNKGLKNPGSICYSNSFIQQLFYIPSFREPILALNINEKSTLSALQKVFVKLKYSISSSVSSKSLIKQFLGSKGLTEQMDTEEFFLILFENCLKSQVGLKFEDIVKENFIGIQNLQIKCNDCGKVFNKEENFKTIGLQIVKNKQNSLMNSLKNFTRGEMLSGENLYYCEFCNRKVDSKIKISFIKLPKNLIFVIKRFEYSVQKNMRLKINEKLEFPETIDLIQFVSHKLVCENRNDYIYKLKGVINHTGTANHGHYISCVKTTDNEWIEFNDSNSTKIPFKKMLKKSFGKTLGNHTTSSAYIIIYNLENSKNLESNHINLNISQNENKLISEIEAKNILNKSKEIWFSFNSIEFFINLLEFQESHLMVLQFILSCYFRMITTPSNKISTYKKIYEKLNTNAVKHLIEILSSLAGIKEFILCNPHAEHKTFLIILIEKHILSFEKDFIGLVFKRLLKIFRLLSINIHKCNTYLNQLFFMILNHINPSMKIDFIENTHFKLFQENMLNLTYIINDFECEFLYDEESEFNYEVTAFKDIDEGSPYSFFKFLVENFDFLNTSQKVYLKDKKAIQKFLNLNNGKLYIIAICQLYAKLFEHNLEEALNFLTIICGIGNYYTKWKYFKIIPVFINNYTKPSELFALFIETFLNILFKDHEKDINLGIEYLIKSLKKVKYSEIESKINCLDQEKLRYLIENFLCENDDDNLMNLSTNFFGDTHHEVFDECDEINPESIKKKKTLWFIIQDEWVEYDVVENFNWKILRLKDDDKEDFLLDYVNFSKIKYI